jgi:hypothetical protein
MEKEHLIFEIRAIIEVIQAGKIMAKKKMIIIKRNNCHNFLKSKKAIINA